MSELSPRYRAVVLVGLAVYLAFRFIGISQEAINWDEFTSFNRVRLGLEDGAIYAGGRPGLLNLLLIPFVSGCTDELSAVTSARILWILLTLGYLAGVFTLVWNCLRTLQDQQLRFEAALLSTCLLALVPLFLRWSLQVRSDHIALMLGVWGGVLLQRRGKRQIFFALLAGLLFGLGFLGSQKVIYVMASVGLLALWQTLDDKNYIIHKQLLCSLAVRLVAMFVGIALPIAAYKLTTHALFGSVSAGHGLGPQLDIFAFYRRVLGYRVYLKTLPSLAPHLALLALAIWTLVKGRKQAAKEYTTPRGLVPTVVLLMVVALAIIFFHAAAFSYFWMTAGLAPALALGLCWPRIVSSFARPRSRTLLRVFAFVSLFIIALPTLLDTSINTKINQRLAYDFVQRNFSRSAHGFQVEGGLFCREARPFPEYLSYSIMTQFSGKPASENIKSFIREFQERPVEYLIDSHRLLLFPKAISKFWDNHFVRYWGNVMIPGKRLTGDKDAVQRFYLLHAGRFRWVLADPANAMTLELVSPVAQTLEPGDEIDLRPGLYRGYLRSSKGTGALVRVVDREVDLRALPFYSEAQRRELSGL